MSGVFYRRLWALGRHLVRRRVDSLMSFGGGPRAMTRGRSRAVVTITPRSSDYFSSSRVASQAVAMVIGFDTALATTTWPRQWRPFACVIHSGLGVALEGRS